MDGARSDALSFNTEARRHREEDFGFWGRDSVNSVALCFQKSAQWMARGLMLFFLTQRHGDTEKRALGFGGETP